VALLLCAGRALAQTDAPPGGMAPMPGMKPGAQADLPASPATQADRAAMQAMMGEMDKPYGGDADQDFVSHMLPHHQGAIDMAKVELQYGHDPRLKQLAARIVADQQREIAFMRSWQAAHPSSAPVRQAR
jgi:uncharacterized protein (DUF305 family)